VASKKVTKSRLEEISIRSLGVIESSNIEFKDGLTVITGETGAGKTMVLTALGLVLGNKSDSDLVRNGQERAIVTGKFSVPEELSAQIIEAGGDVEDGSVVISRTVSAAGKSRVLVGGVLSSTAAVTSFAQSLVEIHAQSSSSKLTKPGVARELLDRFANINLSSYQDTFTEYQQIKRRISELKEQLSQADRQIAELSQLAEDFAKLNPKSGELQEIDNEIAKFGSVESLNRAVSGALNLFENEDISAVNMLQQIRKTLDQVNGKDKQLDQIADRYTESLLNMQDVASDLNSYLSQLEADPIRFEKLQERKASLNSLLKRYGKGSDKEAAFELLLKDGASARQRMADLSGGDQRIAELESEAEKIFRQLQDQANAISRERKTAAAKLSAQVTDEVRVLAMPNASFVIDQMVADSKNHNSYTTTGIDEISILFSAHAGGAALALNKVASGGELSRVMLALEVVIAEAEPIGTYIFDEVDAGVGGKAAVEVGRRLAKLSKSAQVIVITHLAQVAAWADNHLVVKKSENGLVTQSDVTEVSATTRKIEIARMLSGQENSQTAQEHAGELLAIVRNA
jgi:DNA repair protein RecN (Recombination protein N)